MDNRTSRRSRQEDEQDVGTLWTMTRLNASARCALISSSSGWQLRVLVDGTSLLVERCQHAHEAFGIAESWRQRMLRQGWRQVVPEALRTPVTVKRTDEGTSSGTGVGIVYKCNEE